MNAVAVIVFIAVADVACGRRMSPQALRVLIVAVGVAAIVQLVT